MKKLLLILMLTSAFSNAMNQVSNAVIISHDPVKLFYDKTNYYVSNDTASYRVPNHEVTALLKEVLKRNAMTNFSDQCKIQVKKFDEGKYALVEQIPGLGGGLLTGKIAAWATRITGYGGYTVACWFDPSLLLDIQTAHAAIEGTALAAEVIGNSLPTP